MSGDIRENKMAGGYIAGGNMADKTGGYMADKTGRDMTEEIAEYMAG